MPILVHVVRIAALSAALTALTGIVVADVVAAGPELAASSIAADEWFADADARGPVLLAAAVVVPDAAPAPVPVLPASEELLEPPAPRKKDRPRKMKFGRFDGY